MNRPPIVAILGHVDHGKTSLLDFIRKSRLASKEHGGITQRIGAYEIDTGIKGYETDRITFIDTPGHEAFSKIRSRGATVADIAILVVDAKDSVMPQTVESIAHIKEAKIPFIVALNKMDLPDANPEKVKRDLMRHEIVTEDKGGNVIAMPISAKTGKGVPELLEAILLLSSENKLSYEPANVVNAYIIETKKDQRGIIVSVIIKDGTIKVGDEVYAGEQKIKIRALVNDLGKSITEVVPSTPFEILGFNELPEVGTLITTDEKALEKGEIEYTKRSINMESFLAPEVKEKKLSLIVKADAQGSLEAIMATLTKNKNVDIILGGVGNVHRSDIFLAKTTKAIVIGFSVPIDNEVKELAKQEKVIIKTYTIIYELIDELQEVSDIIREKEEKEKDLKAEGKVLATFIIEGEKIFGAKITKGKVNVGDNAEVFRAGVSVGKTRLVSLKMRAKTVIEVKKDQECGLLFAPELDIKVGDMVKFIL